MHLLRPWTAKKKIAGKGATATTRNKGTECRPGAGHCQAMASLVRRRYRVRPQKGPARRALLAQPLAPARSPWAKTPWVQTGTRLHVGAIVPCFVRGTPRVGRPRREQSWAPWPPVSRPAGYLLLERPPWQRPSGRGAAPDEVPGPDRYRGPFRVDRLVSIRLDGCSCYEVYSFTESLRLPTSPPSFLFPPCVQATHPAHRARFPSLDSTSPSPGPPKQRPAAALATRGARKRLRSQSPARPPINHPSQSQRPISSFHSVTTPSRPLPPTQQRAGGFEVLSSAGRSATSPPAGSCTLSSHNWAFASIRFSSPHLFLS